MTMNVVVLVLVLGVVVIRFSNRSSLLRIEDNVLHNRTVSDFQVKS